MTTNTQQQTEKTVEAEVTSPIVAGIDLSTLSDTDMATIVAQLKARAEALAPLKLERRAVLQQEIEERTAELKTINIWFHNNGVRIARTRPDGSPDPDQTADVNPESAPKKRGRPAKNTAN
jgi:hypothetical protein